MRGLGGRTYIVTGAASGIGHATAARLLDEGALVMGADLAVPPDDTTSRPPDPTVVDSPMPPEETTSKPTLRTVADTERPPPSTVSVPPPDTVDPLAVPPE